MIILYAELFIALNIVFFLFSSAVPGLESPLTTMFSSSHFLWLVFYTAVLFLFGKGIEAQVGGTRFAVTYLSAGVIGNIGLLGVGAPEGIAMGAAAPLFGLMGALVAIRPGAIVVMDIFPMPAFASAAFVLIVHYVGKGGVDAFPFLVGMLIGYSMRGSLEAQAGGGPPGAARFAR